ncbi:unnamed protein product [Orchesella dallaii]|uniref:Pacifastin domain-containing protein n=1 Tax=Orchesella dallaii TaxID=48710 RepID=A0ABP1PV89_9HEXA
MRATHEGSAIFSTLSDLFKTVLLIWLIGVVFGVSSFPQQRNNFLFPNGESSYTNNGNEIVPVLSDNIGNLQSDYQSGPGTTGIPCDRPGSFVMAPDGCNRCVCAENRHLSNACSRAFCPPGFPSGSSGQYKL